MSNISQNKKFHFIYKTTNLLNETFYYGMHSTSNLKDGYLGSGKRLGYSIKKYGKENFKCEILEFLPDRETLVLKEIELITSEMLQHPLCMNLKTGGQGGFCNEEHKRKCQCNGGLATQKFRHFKHLEKLKDREYYTNWNTNSINGLLNYYKTHNNVRKNRKHSVETKHKMSVSGSGLKNSQFGTCWITNDKDNKKIKIDELDAFLLIGWHKGRKLNKQLK